MSEPETEISTVSVPRPVLLGLDWGSTRVRAWLLDAGANILATDSLDAGVRSARGEVCARVLDLITSEWMDEIADLPTMLSGMVGSAQGWVDAPYVGAPAGLREIADSVVTAPRERTWIVPGVAGTGVSGAPDVMRGEETQLLGLEDDERVIFEGVCEDLRRLIDA